MDRDTIIAAGLELVRSGGLARLSTRKLAEVLEVQGPALYHHYRSKEELLGDMANAVVESALGTLPPDLDWAAWSAAFARRIRKAVLGYVDGALLLTKGWPTETMRSRTIPRLEEPLIRAGFSPDQAHEVSFLLASFVIGWVINEQNPRIQAFIAERMDADAAFDRSLEMIIDGARLRLTADDLTAS